MKSISGAYFCRDIESNGERILLFLTNAFTVHLNNAKVWIMDGTFDTVPPLFQQLYTIHRSIGATNSRILPVVYALMTHKSRNSYVRLFQEIKSIANQRGYNLQPDFILTDFKWLQ